MMNINPSHDRLLKDLASHMSGSSEDISEQKRLIRLNNTNVRVH